MGRSAKSTTDHEKIRKWAEARDASPATVKGTGTKGEPGLLRIDFPGYTGAQTLEHITWEQFFEKFEEQQLAFLYQNKTESGKPSRFCKLVSRDAEKKTGAGKKSGAAAKSAGKAGAAKKGATAKGAAAKGATKKRAPKKKAGTAKSGRA